MQISKTKKTRWDVSEQSNAELINQLSIELNHLDKSLTSILVKRGITDYEKAKQFFRPSLKSLYNPFLMKDMDKASDRIIAAINNGEKILVFGDYDVDGTTSVAMFSTFLENQNADFLFYIPDRYSEGYGISTEGIDFALENNCKVMVALDCGIKAIDKANYAKEKGIDLIVCDHHLPGEELPNAFAVLDPKRKDCLYPFKELSGCGVGFKLVQAVCEKKQIPFSEIQHLLEYLAISIAADIVPILDENRVLTYFGLEIINQQPRAGIKTLLELAGFDFKKRKVNVTDLVFLIAPRINAAGRMDDAKDAVKVLMAKTEEQANEVGNLIQSHNTDRKEIDRQICEEALKMIEASEILQNRKSTVLYQEHWHKGVVGIVASRVIETYYKPTIILCGSEGKVAGSARSVRGYNVHEAIEKCAHLLEKFGGHKYAAGLTMLPENVEAFAEAFEKAVCENITDELLTPSLQIDEEISFAQIDERFVSILKQMAPFGPGNMRPVFTTKEALASEYRLIGEDHLKLKVFEPTDNRIKFDVIGWGMGRYINEISEGVPFDIAYTIEENHWNGNTTIQLKLKGLKLA